MATLVCSGMLMTYHSVVITTCTMMMKNRERSWLTWGMVPPRPTDTRLLSCITLMSRRPKQRQKARGWKKCLMAQIMAEGGRSQGTAEPNRRMTPSSSSTPMLWLPLSVPSHIFRKTYTNIQRLRQMPKRATLTTTRAQVRPMKDSYVGDMAARSPLLVSSSCSSVMGRPPMERW